MAVRVSQVTVQIAEQVTNARVRVSQATILNARQYTGEAKVRVSQVTVLYAKGPAAGGGLMLRGLGS